MKENNKEEEYSSSKNLLDKITEKDTIKSDIFIELEDKTPETYQDQKIRRETQSSFTKALLNKVHREEEEEFIKQKMKETQRLLNQIKSLSRKDYVVFFFILLACGLNSNYLFLPFVLISIIYYFAIENLSFKALKLKYFLEIFSVGYASYIFIYKVIIYSLIQNDNQSVIDNSCFYIDFGVCILKDYIENKENIKNKENIEFSNNFFLTFAPELIIIAVSGYGILISFRSRLLKKTDTPSTNISAVKLSKYILFIYLIIVSFTNLNLSYLSLFYILCFQLAMLFNSLKFQDNSIKKLLKFIMHFLIFIIGIQIILINILNIYSFQKSSEDYYDKLKEKDDIRQYFTWQQIGVNNRIYKNNLDELHKLGAYCFAIITIMVLKNIINILNKEIDLEPEIDNVTISKNTKKDMDAIARIREIISTILSTIMMFLSNPTFNFEFSRILSIAWTYYYINIYSLGILIFIFLSFFSVHIKKNKCLVLYILTPMLILSLGSFHLTNINGIAEFDVNNNTITNNTTNNNTTINNSTTNTTLDEIIKEKKMNYMKLAIGKYKHPMIEYWIGHLFYIIIMFLINSIYTDELKPRNIGSIKNIEIKRRDKVNEEVMNNEEDRNKNEENKDEESKEEEKNDENNNEGDKKEIIYDYSHSINDNRDNSLLKNNEDDEEKKEKEKEKNFKNYDDLLIKQKRIKFRKNLNGEGEITFITLIVKGIFMHIDKITLIVMYLVSVYTVNLIHVILVFILIFQIIAPGLLNGCYKVITLIFQLLYLIEFFIALFKIQFYNSFKDHTDLLQFFFVFSEDKYSNDIEFFIYGVILCFYFQYRTSNIDSIKNVLKNKNISTGEYIKLKLKKYPNLQSAIFLLGNISLHLYLWSLIFAFIFFNSFFEINLFFGFKLIIFLICCYKFILVIQSINRNTNIKIIIIFNRILLFLCCLNTLLVYLYQFLCKDFLKIEGKIKPSSNSNDTMPANETNTNFFIKNSTNETNTNFFIKNLPTLGFTKYEEENLYYNFLPHFITTFIAILYLWRTEETIQIMIEFANKRRSTVGKRITSKMKKKLEEKERMKKIEEEKNEFIQDKLYADKYDENSVELQSKSRNLLKANIFLFFTQCYWLALFFTIGIIFGFYDLSFSMFIYIIIFGSLSIAMFFNIIIKLTRYIKNKSYFISKVIRFSIVEKPRNREINKKYRLITFRCLLFFSFLYIVLIYFYGIFGLFQHGCNPGKFKGCDNSYAEIVEADSSSDHNNVEAKIKSLAFIFGIYFDIGEENILQVSLAHLILTCLIIFDLYNQKLEDYYLNLSESLVSDIQNLANENNVLQKYADIADLNILIQIGLSIAGINLNAKRRGRSGSRISLVEQFCAPQNSSISDSTDKNENLNNNENEDEDEPLKVDNPKQNIQQCYDLNEKSDSNSFLKNNKIQKFIEMIRKSNDNKQKLSVSNTKERIIYFIKRIMEQFIIFISLCLGLSKLNVYSSIYFIVTFIFIFQKKSMLKFYLLYIFIYLGAIVQSFFFIINVNEFSNKRINETKFYFLNETLNIPIYREILNLTESEGLFYGFGTNKSQVNLIWLDFFAIIIIYLYLNYFSYSIYQDIINLGSSSLSDQKFDFDSLNMEEGSIEQIKTMTDYQYFQLKECLSCFNFHIGNNLSQFFQLLKIDKNKYINYFDTKTELNLNLTAIKNPILKELIEYRMYEKEYLDKVERRKKGTYKPLPRYLLILQQILYLYFHCFLLILIIMLSIMTAGVLSAIYFAMCFYYLIKSDCIYLGQEYSYPKAIKNILRIIVLIDIFMQGSYQLSIIPMVKGGLIYKIFRAIGFIKIEENKGKDELDTHQIELFGKALIYFFISVQNLIYNSKNFKRYYLVYLLENKFQTNKTSLVNAFTFNNDRVKIYQKSLSIRQKSVEAMDDLNKVITELNSKLNKMGEKLFSKNKFEVKQRPLEFINNQELSGNYDSNNITNNFINNNNIEEKPKDYLEVEEIKKRIKSMLCDKFITKVYLWLHKYSANYKNIDKDAKNDFYIETIKGETSIKSIIEADIDRALSIVDLTCLEQSDMKDIEILIESQFNEEIKRILMLRREREMKSKENISKFKKFANNLIRLNKFAKMIYGQFYTGNLEEHIRQNKDNLLELFRIQTEKERIEKEKRDKEAQIKNQKLKYIEELFDTKLFKKYLKTSYQLRHILLYLQSLFINHFTWICYFFMILDHMISSSAITLIYPISIFCYALLEYPRPKKSYWMLCIIYTMIIMFIKFIIQLKIIHIFLEDERAYENVILQLHNYRIGFKYFDSTFNKDFIKYIFFDGLVIFSILINRNLLIMEGLWFRREEEIENIYEASERISIYKTKKYNNKFEAMQDLLLKYIYTPREVINIKRNLEKSDTQKIKGNIIENRNIVKHKFPFFGKRNMNPEYNEAKKSYFSKLFPKNRNEKPGNDYYAAYTLVMFLICLYILVFYTEMDQDKTYGSVNLDTTQFSGNMVLILILHIIILAYDRVIFVLQNRENIEYEYYFYKRNKNNGQGELISEIELNNIKSELTKNDENSKFNKISVKEIERLKEKYNIFFIQKESFNKPLLNKYILHIFTTILIHFMVFFYFPIKGNINLGNEHYCSRNTKTCNDFTSNKYMIIFYLIYLFYLILSALQIQSGFYDIKRKSLFKKKDDEMFSNMCSLFQAIPFLNEIKNALDWTFTSTCFNLIQWNKFEAIYDTIFDTYCEKSDWDEKPIGKKISKKQKYTIGGSLSLILIIILTIPLILFSSLNPTNKPNNLTGAKMTVDLFFNYKNGAIKKYNIFENTRADSISEIDNDDTLWEKYHYSESVQTRNFNKKQVQRVIFSETSDRNWDLATPHINNLITLLDLKNNSDLSSIQISIGYELSRPLPAEAQTCSDAFIVDIYKEGVKSNTTFVDDFRTGLENCEDTSNFINNSYSHPLRLTSGSEVNEIEDDIFPKIGITIGFQGCEKDSDNKINYFNSYFTVKSVYEGEEGPLELHVFNDQISETTSGYSVLTFYVSFVLLAGSYVREFLANEPEKIMLEELPHPKKIVELCEGIKIARYSYDFKNEEYLYTILIELMRSPDYLKLITDSSLDHFKQREEMTENS